MMNARPIDRGTWIAALCAVAALLGCGSADRPSGAATSLELIRPDKSGASFVGAESGKKFIVWGVNYDHDHSGRLLEDYWDSEWGTVEEDFREIKALGANVVRVHLQLAKFMRGPGQPDGDALKQLARLVGLSERTGLYLDITGLGCYHKQDVPAWYDPMTESERWDVQAMFWKAVAKTCAGSPAIFCYDLMNEPVLAGGKTKETEWLGNPLGDKHFVQRITLDLAGRTREQVARQWVDKLVEAIRAEDKMHMITVGEIPWAFVFPGAKPFFSSKEVGDKLDFASVHFYPKKGEVDKALAALAVYDAGKPLLVEEMFPLACGVDELDAFVEGSRKFADGWVGFYWGKTIEEYPKGSSDMAGAITRRWLEYFRAKAPAILGEASQAKRAHRAR